MPEYGLWEVKPLKWKDRHELYWRTTILWFASVCATCSPTEEGFDVVGEADDGDEAITQTLDLQPDILLLDVAMPRLPGLEAMRAIMKGSPTVKILLLTSTITTQQIIEALHIGARGIVLKDALAGHLKTAIRTVCAGDYWIGGKRVVNLVSALHDLMQQAAPPPAQDLRPYSA